SLIAAGFHAGSAARMPKAAMPHRTAAATGVLKAILVVEVIIFRNCGSGFMTEYSTTHAPLVGSLLCRHLCVCGVLAWWRTENEIPNHQPGSRQHEASSDVGRDRATGNAE